MSSMNVVPPPVGLVKVNELGNPITTTLNNNTQLSQLVKMLGGKKRRKKKTTKGKKIKHYWSKKVMNTRKRKSPKQNSNSKSNLKSKFSSFSSSFVSSSVRSNQNKPKNEIKYASNVEWMPWTSLTNYNYSQPNIKPHFMSTSWDYKGPNLKSLSRRHLNKMNKWTKKIKKIKPLSSPPTSIFSSSFIQQPNFYGGNVNSQTGIEVATVPVPYQETTPKGSDLVSITSNLASTINQSHANAVFDNSAK